MRPIPVLPLLARIPVDQGHQTELGDAIAKETDSLDANGQQAIPNRFVGYNEVIVCP